MRELLVLTADTDAQAVMQVVLQERYQAIGLNKAVDAEVDRYHGRDAGLVKEGTGLLRLRKKAFQRVILLWDHHGSGKTDPGQVQQQLSQQLSNDSWSGNHLAQAIVPELEEWLWHSPEAIRKYLAIKDATLQQWQNCFANQQKRTVDECQQQLPKELFFYCMQQKENRHPRPEDYREIARKASLKAWQNSDSFRAIITQLKAWFL
ncbi:MAG: hypothetical protein HQM06_10930 [Magnetococcales bacterium]|nr:hypothetical protein [Magnetococcales bacterium]